MNSKQTLKGKDLINIGIYAAIFCVIVTAIAMLGFIPIMLPMLCVFVPILGGIPYMLFLTKVDKFGMITIFSTIVGLFLWVTGMGYWPTIFGVVFGVLTDLIAKSGNYKSSKKDILGCGVFNIAVFGNFVPLFTNIDAYFSTRQSFGEEYIGTLTGIFANTWLIPAMIASCVICGWIGGFLGKALLKKHFEKAGIA